MAHRVTGTRIGQLGLALMLLIVLGFNQSLAIRKRLFPDQEIDYLQLDHIYRELFGDKLYYGLQFAGLLNSSRLDGTQLDYVRGSDGQMKHLSYEFNFEDISRKILLSKWYLTWMEHSALHVYDDPKDLELARGPQFNQSLCGQHLDYILHLKRQYNRHLYNSSELSTTLLIHSFGLPHLGLLNGNKYWLGDYLGCLDNPIHLVRREWAKVNATAAKLWFEENKQSADRRLKEGISMFQFIKESLGPFFGLARETRKMAPIDHFADQIAALPMRYCLANLRYTNWSNGTFLRRIQKHTSAVCLPESCDSSSALEYRDKIEELIKSSMGEYQREQLYLQDMYCLPDEESPLRNPFNYPATNLFVLFNVIWLLLILWASLRETPKGKQSALGYLLTSWSFTNNMESFFKLNLDDEPLESITDKTTRRKLNTKPLEGLKVAGSVSVILSHCVIAYLAPVWNNGHGESLIREGLLAMTLSVCPAVVDLFYVVTGILTVQLIMQTHSKQVTKLGFWFKFLLFRYLRIVPFYLLCHWFLQDGFRFLGSGPLWDYGTSQTAWSWLCREESWSVILLARSNLRSPAVHCDGAGWSLSSDIQFALITPLLIYLLVKRPRVGHASIWASVAVLSANHVRYFYQTPQVHRATFEASMAAVTRVLDDLTAGYVFPQYRVVAFLVGLSAGHLLHLYSTDRIHRWPSKLVRCGKLYVGLICYLICVTPYLSTLLPLDNGDVMQLLGPLRDGTFHIINSLAISIFVLFLCTGQYKFLEKLLGWRPFKIISKTSLTILLIHIPVIFYHIGTTHSLPYLTSHYIFSVTVVTCFEVFLLAPLVHLIYEVPLRKSLTTLFMMLLNEPSDRPKIDEPKQKSKVN